MSVRSIADKVAIVGMACTELGMRADKTLHDLLLDAAIDALSSARITLDDVDAYWFGNFGSAVSGTTLAKALRLDNKPVTRIENYCSTGGDTFRNACYAVASGAVDVAMAIGGEKMRDSGMVGIPVGRITTDGTTNEFITPVGMFGQAAVAYSNRYGVSESELRDAMTHVFCKNTHNGTLNPLSQVTKEIPAEKVSAGKNLAAGLTGFDCAPVADGAAAAIVVPAEDAYRYTDRPIFVKALALSAGPGTGYMDPRHNFATMPEVRASAKSAYEQAGVHDPRSDLALAEVHDCFTISELILMEDLGFCAAGTAWKESLAGTFDLDGELPVNTDGGLTSCGHPIGASGLRMIYECWLQLRGQGGPRQVTNGKKLALSHNIGGSPGDHLVSFVSIIGSELG